jgi:acetyl-CoA carboxylase biotin carboxyl carrier protein
VSDKSPSKRKARAEPSLAGNALPEIDQVREWIDLMDERGVEEFELEKDGLRIRIRRRGSGLAPPPVFESYEGSSAPPPPVAAREIASMESSGEGVRVAEDLHIIKSPIVGTFYAAPQPGAPPFVEHGSTVEVGQVLCIVEAMKLMNEIEADVAGEIVRIYIESGQPVEYGESLFAIRPARKK